MQFQENGMTFKHAGLLVVAIGIAALQTAFAADMPVKAPVYKAPRSAVASDIWSGLYFGGHLGGAWAQTRASDPLGISGPAGVFNGRTGSSFIGGPQIGANWQIGTYVFGIQGDVSFGNMKASIPSPNIGTEALDFKTTSVTTVTARWGYAWDTWLFYVKGGGAWAHTKYELTDTTFGIQGDGRATQGGYTVGAGWEFAFAPNWSVFLEYDYVGLGTKSQIPLTGPGGTFPLDIKQDIQMVKTGLNFRLWPWASGMGALARR
jgi:outer membrane immunogenic protein